LINHTYVFVRVERHCYSKSPSYESEISQFVILIPTLKAEETKTLINQGLQWSTSMSWLPKMISHYDKNVKIILSLKPVTTLRNNIAVNEQDCTFCYTLIWCLWCR
jgi:hypothetical protein